MVHIFLFDSAGLERQMWEVTLLKFRVPGTLIGWPIKTWRQEGNTVVAWNANRSQKEGEGYPGYTLSPQSPIRDADSAGSYPENIAHRDQSSCDTELSGTRAKNVSESKLIYLDYSQVLLCPFSSFIHSLKMYLSSTAYYTNHVKLLPWIPDLCSDSLLDLVSDSLTA